MSLDQTVERSSLRGLARDDATSTVALVRAAAFSGGAVPAPSIHRELRGRTFMFLQGPPGAFFQRLARELEAAGATTVKVAFNAGDYLDSLGVRRRCFRATPAEWPSWLVQAAREERISDLVLYGDCRPYHRAAISALKALGVRIHVFEEGYLRPDCITYERDGVNGFSPLVALDCARLAAALPDTLDEPAMRPAGNGIWPYVAYGVRYHACNALAAPLFPAYQSHREMGIAREAAAWARRLAGLAVTKLRSRVTLGRVMAGPQFHLVLLQLSGDSQLAVHSDFVSLGDVVDVCVAAYKRAGCPDGGLVFKSHPLDSGVANLPATIRAAARRQGVEAKCHFIDGGKLAPLLDHARSVVSVNSTACHQALMRGIPTKLLGSAIYRRPAYVCEAPLDRFFAAPQPPDADAYRRLRILLMRTCQFNGSFYRRRGIDMLLAPLIDRMASTAPTEDFYRPGPHDLHDWLLDAAE